ncbi:hypothetical protein, partial [Glycomyces tenuis]
TPAPQHPSTLGPSERLLILAGRTSQALARLYFDVAPLIAHDPRIAVAYALIPGSRFEPGAPVFARRVGIDLHPWDTAKVLRPNLIVTSSPDPCLYEAGAPVLSLPHGAGHNRLRAELSGVSGLSPEQILGPQGQVPSFLALPGPAAAKRLAIDCPTATGNAEVIGDLCLDRLRRSAHLREDYRRAFGVGPDRRLVVISSSWDRSALTRKSTTLPEQLLGELPMDEFKLAFVPHPNDEVGEAPHPVESLRPYVDNGLIMIPPEEGWRALVLAADCLIGDHGSVTFTAAAMGVPVLLASFGFAGMPPDVPLARFGRIAPRFEPNAPAAPQIRAAIEAGPVGFDFADALAEPEPGAPFLLAEAVYRLIGLDALELVEPEPLPLPAPVPEHRDTRAWRCRTRPTTAGAAWERRPASVPEPGEGHLAADVTCRDGRLRSAANVLVRHRGTVDPAMARQTLRAMLEAHPVCTVASARVGAGEVMIAVRDGTVLRVGARPAQLDLIPSAVYERLAEQGSDAPGLSAAETLVYLQRRFEPGPAFITAEDAA